MKIRNSQGKQVDIPKGKEEIVKKYIASGKHDKVTELVDSLGKSKLKAFGGNIITTKSNDMKVSKKEMKKNKLKELELKKYGGMKLPKKDGEQSGMVDDSYYNQPPQFGSYFGNSLNSQNLGNDPQRLPETAINFPHYGFDNMGGNEANMAKIPSQQIPYSQSIASTTSGGSMGKEDKKSQNWWNLNNYTTPWGHSGNYWGDFIGRSGQATDALAHAIPSTIGTLKQNKFNTDYEANQIKSQSQFFQPTPPNYGSNRGLMALGGVNDYKANGGNLGEMVVHAPELGGYFKRKS